MVSVLRGILGALEPPDAVLGRARAAEGVRVGSRGDMEQTARVEGPGGSVVIPLRLVHSAPDEVHRLVRAATLEPGPLDFAALGAEQERRVWDR